jgi:hypothetical protein
LIFFFAEKNKELIDEIEQLKEEKEIKFSQIDDKDLAINNLMLDKNDLLQLINILATAPISAKNVLESYLAKLAGAAGTEKFLREKVFGAKNTPMGERIQSLLEWKRNNEAKFRPSSTKKPSVEEKKESDEEEQRNEDEDGEENQMAEEEDEDDEEEQPEGEKEYQNYKGKELLLNVSAIKKQQQQTGNEEPQGRLPALSPQEKKSYGGIGKLASSGSKQSSRATTPNQNVRLKTGATTIADGLRDASPEVSVTSVNRLKSSALNNFTPSSQQQQQLMNDQYDLARKYYQTQKLQAKLSEQMTNSNLTLQEMETEKQIQEAIQGTNRSRSNSPQRLPQNRSATTTTDSEQPQTKPEWIECFDPKSGRNYYYNTVQKKSTWKNPFKTGGAAATTTSTTVDQQQEPQQHQSRSRQQTPNKITAQRNSSSPMGKNRLIDANQVLQQQPQRSVDRRGNRQQFDEEAYYQQQQQQLQGGDDNYVDEDNYYEDPFQTGRSFTQQQQQQQAQFQQQQEEEQWLQQQQQQQAQQRQYDGHGYPINNGNNNKTSKLLAANTPFSEGGISSTTTQSSSSSNSPTSAVNTVKIPTKSISQGKPQQQQKKPLEKKEKSLSKQKLIDLL